MGKKGKGAKGPAPTFRSRTTRSSKGRLLSLPSSDSSSALNANLTHQLQLLGLYAAPTLADGNCLFRALSDQIFGTPEKHAQVRREVCDWIEKYGERYEGFVEGEGSDDDGGRGRRRREKEKGKGKALEVYLRNMRENATYGGHMELSAFAHMTRRNVKVIQPGLVYVIEWDAWGGFEEDENGAQGSTSSSASNHGSASANGHAGYDEESDLTEDDDDDSGNDENDDDDDDEEDGDDGDYEDEAAVRKVRKGAMGGAIAGSNDLSGTGLDSLSSLTSISTSSTVSPSGAPAPMSSSTAPLSSASTSSMTPRRPTRSSLPSSAAPVKSKTAKEKTKGKDDVGKEKIKIGKGYYYLEEVTSSEEEGGGDNVDDDADEEGKVAVMCGVVEGDDASGDRDNVRVGDEVSAHQVEGVPWVGGDGDVKMDVDDEVKKEDVRVAKEAVKEKRREKERKEKKEKKPVVEVQQPPRSKRECGGPTVYVAYHDWEHFSSIRNLRGPHVGLPNVQETPAQSLMDSVDEDMEGEQVQTMTPKERERERKREERKERERKDAERRKRKEERRAREREERAAEIARDKEMAAASAPPSSSSGVKIMLKLPRSGTASRSGTTTPAAVATGAGGADPSLVPLPDSRTISPFGTSTPNLDMNTSSSGVAQTQPSSDLDSSITPTALSHPMSSSTHLGGEGSVNLGTTATNGTPASLPRDGIHPLGGTPTSLPRGGTPSSLPRGGTPSSLPRGGTPSSLPRASTPHLTSDRTQYRSPKRSFDESSASGGEDAVSGREAMKRSRRVVEEIVGASGVMDVDVDVDVDGDGDGEGGGDTPGLSAPGSSSSASETSSEIASEVSEGAGFGSSVPVLGHSKDATITAATVNAKPTSTASLPPDTPTTIRASQDMQTPSPKSARKLNSNGEKHLTRRERKALGLPKYGSGGSAPNSSISAGKIVIPGGRFKGRMAAQAAANARAAAASAGGRGVGGGGGGAVRVSGAVGGGVEGEDGEEWRRNGTGRLDVRGFRELKI